MYANVVLRPLQCPDWGQRYILHVQVYQIWAQQNFRLPHNDNEVEKQDFKASKRPHFLFEDCAALLSSDLRQIETAIFTATKFFRQQNYFFTFCVFIGNLENESANNSGEPMNMNGYK